VNPTAGDELDGCFWGPRRFEVHCSSGTAPDLQERDDHHYIGLLNFTDKGIHGVKETTKRAAAAKAAAKKFGVNMRGVYWTMGEYDLVCVLEADNEASLTAFNLATAMQGNVRTRSLRAFSASEMETVLAKLP